MNSLVVLFSADLIFISRYFKSDFMLIKKVSQANVRTFRDEKVKIFVSLFFILCIILSSIQNFI